MADSINELIEKLSAIDESGRKISDSVMEQQKAIRKEHDERIAAYKKQLTQESEEKLNKLSEELREKSEREIKEYEAELNSSLIHMETEYKENKDKWINEIFETVIGE